MAQRGPRKDRPQENRERREAKGDMLDRLELTEDQKAQIEEYRLAHMKSMQSLKNQLNIKRAELQASITSDNPEKKEIDVLIDEISNLSEQQMTARIYHQLDVRGILTEEQKVKFDLLHQRLGMKNQRHPGGPHGF